MGFRTPSGVYAGNTLTGKAFSHSPHNFSYWQERSTVALLQQQQIRKAWAWLPSCLPLPTIVAANMKFQNKNVESLLAIAAAPLGGYDTTFRQTNLETCFVR